MNIKRALEIDGWMSEQELEWLAERASEHKVIVEVGCFLGRTTRALADNTSGIVHAVDMWLIEPEWDENAKVTDPEAWKLFKSYIDPFSTFQKNLEDLIPHKVIPFKGKWEIFGGITPDMIFIDADHNYGNVFRDIAHAMYMMGSGIICGHDYDSNVWPDVKRAVDNLFSKVEQPVGSIWSVRI